MAGTVRAALALAFALGDAAGFANHFGAGVGAPPCFATNYKTGAG